MANPIKENFTFLKGDIKYHPTTNVKLEYLEKSNAVCIILFDFELKKVLLVEQYRPGVDKNTFENVAGLIDEGESPLNAVKRELKEETGYNFEDVDNFIEMKNPLAATPGYSTENLYFYAARLKNRDIRPGSQNFDEGEDINCHWINIDEVENYLIDMKTLLSIIYFLPILKKEVENSERI